MLYSCTNMATVGVIGLTQTGMIYYLVNVHLLKSRLDDLKVADILMLKVCVKLHLFHEYRSYRHSHYFINKFNH